METTVEKTTNYEMFKTLDGNRCVNEAHVRRLMESFKRKYLQTPVYVNNKNFIIDGQHRIEAAKRLGLPVYYIRVNGYALEDVQQLNSNNKTWNKYDYLNSYCSLGYKPYLQMKEFMANYPQFGIATAEIILTNDPWGIDSGKITEKGTRYRKHKPFEEGKLVIKDLGLAYENAGKISEYRQFFSEYNSRSFVRIMVNLLKRTNFKHEILIGKLTIQPNALVKCATSEQYRTLIEDIYNYKSRCKVSLKY